MQTNESAKPKSRPCLIGGLGLLLALAAQADAPPTFISLQPEAEQVTVTVAVADWVKQLTLEAKPTLETATWVKRAWQPVAGAGTITFSVWTLETMGFLRLRAEALPAFLDRVTLGLAAIKIDHPEAVLYEVNQTGPEPTLDPNDLSQLRIVCRVEGGTALVSSTGADTFGPVDFIAQPWLGDRDIPWPVAMDVMEAVILLQDAGFRKPFRTITLRQPVYPGMVEPYFIFGMTSGEFVFVGSNSGDVFVGQ